MEERAVGPRARRTSVGPGLYCVTLASHRTHAGLDLLVPQGMVHLPLLQGHFAMLSLQWEQLGTIEGAAAVSGWSSTLCLLHGPTAPAP